MKKRKIIKIILILFVISVCVYYLFKDNTDYSTKPLPTTDRLLYKKIYLVYLDFAKNFNDDNILENIQVSRKTNSDQEMQLILEAEKINCVSSDDCLDLLNIDKLAEEARIFNEKNNNLWHLYNKKIVNYSSSVSLFNSNVYEFSDLNYFDEQKKPIQAQDCISKIGDNGYDVYQELSICEGKYLAEGCGGPIVRNLFFTSNNKYICGTQYYPAYGI